MQQVAAQLSFTFLPKLSIITHYLVLIILLFLVLLLLVLLLLVLLLLVLLLLVLLLLVLLKQARYQLVLHLFHLHPACPKDPLSAHLLFLLTKCNRCIKVNNQVLSLGKDLLSRTKVVGQAVMDGMVQEIKTQLCHQLILILLVQLRLTALGLEMVLRRGKLTTLMS